MLKVVAHGGDLSTEERDEISELADNNCVFIEGFKPANEYRESPYLPRYVYDILNQALENGINHHNAHTIHRAHELQLPIQVVPTKFTSGKDLGCTLLFLEIHAQFNLLYGLIDNGEADFEFHILNVERAPLTVKRYIKGFEKMPNVVVEFVNFSEAAKTHRILPLDEGNNIDVQYVFDKVRHDRLMRLKAEAESDGIKMTPFNREGNYMITQRPHGNHVIADRIKDLSDEDREKLEQLTKKGSAHKRTGRKPPVETTVVEEPEVDLIDNSSVVEETPPAVTKKKTTKRAAPAKKNAVEDEETPPVVKKKKKVTSSETEDKPSTKKVKKA
jgi:hypothetical protein